MSRENRFLAVSEYSIRSPKVQSLRLVAQEGVELRSSEVGSNSFGLRDFTSRAESGILSDLVSDSARPVAGFLLTWSAGTLLSAVNSESFSADVKDPIRFWKSATLEL